MLHLFYMYITKINAYLVLNDIFRAKVGYVGYILKEYKYAQQPISPYPLLDTQH